MVAAGEDLVEVEATEASALEHTAEVEVGEVGSDGGCSFLFSISRLKRKIMQFMIQNVMKQHILFFLNLITSAVDTAKNPMYWR